MRWLPRWCMKEKPCSRRSRLTSVAESGRSLGMGQFEGLDAPAQLQPALDLFRAGGVQPKFHRFRQHGVRFLASFALAGNAQFGTGGDMPVLVFLNDCGKGREFDHFAVLVNPTDFHYVELSLNLGQAASHNPSFLNRSFTSLKWKSSERNFFQFAGLERLHEGGHACCRQSRARFRETLDRV